MLAKNALQEQRLCAALQLCRTVAEVLRPCVFDCVTAGTGGSLLIIGSAAGVAVMGLEGIGFGWYVRRVTPWALAGYGAAIVVYVGLHGLAGPAV